MAEPGELGGESSGNALSKGDLSGLEVVPRCDLCGSDVVQPLLVNRDRFFGLPGEFGLVRCGACGLVRLSPRPNNEMLATYYPAGEYYAYQPPGDPASASRRYFSTARDVLRGAGLASLGYPVDHLPGWARWVAPRLPNPIVRRAAYGRQGFPRWVTGGRALDIGCGNGAFLNALRRDGWHVTGVDISPVAAEVAQTAYGITVHVGELAQAPLEDGSFDFIHMSHVIEHLNQPVTTLEQVSRLLRPGGRLYVETPNIESIGFRRCQEFWYPLETPRHLWLFSPETLSRALSRAGLQPRRLYTQPFPTYAWEATYRREEREGRLLATRPAVEARSVPRVASRAAASRILRWMRPDVGDILCCWAVPA